MPLEYNPTKMWAARQLRRLTSARRQKENFSVNSESSATENISKESCQNVFCRSAPKNRVTASRASRFLKNADLVAHPSALQALVIGSPPNSLSPLALRLSPSWPPSGKRVTARHSASPAPCVFVRHSPFPVGFPLTIHTSLFILHSSFFINSPFPACPFPLFPRRRQLPNFYRENTNSCVIASYFFKKAGYIVHSLTSEPIATGSLAYPLPPFSFYLLPLLPSSGRCVMMRHMRHIEVGQQVRKKTRENANEFVPFAAIRALCVPASSSAFICVHPRFVCGSFASSSFNPKHVPGQSISGQQVIQIHSLSHTRREAELEQFS
jgi:hypothetical protein